jgi:glycosyltransferase involved in cell wall biosynthesis
MSIQVYGQFQDHASIANVSRAIACELRKRHARATIYGAGSLNQTYVSQYLPIAFNNAAAVAVFVGYPESATAYLHGHRFKILVTVCETDRIPKTWVEACNEVDLVVVPSEWCREAFESSGVKKPIEVVRHGVWPQLLDGTGFPRNHEHIAISSNHIEPYVFLHVSGATSFPGRKGTGALLLAFKRFLEKRRCGSELYLKTTKTGGLERAIADLGLKDNVFIHSTPSLSPFEMGGYIQHFDAVVQPSRAEGFGIVPLEARCVGVPTILTYATGHCEHFAVGTDVGIAHGRLSPLATQGNPVGAAPEVSVDDITNALLSFTRDYDQHRQRTRAWARENARKWFWSEQLRPLIKRILDEDKGENKRIKLGAGASLRGA